MARSLLSAAALALIAAVLPASASPQAQSDLAYIQSEINFLNPIGSRLTGTPNHNKLIDHIIEQLQGFGLKPEIDTITFPYVPPAPKPGTLTVGSENVNLSSVYTYSGITGPQGITGPLYDLTGVLEPDWSKAAGGIAIVNLTNNVKPVPSGRLPTWPSSPAWPDIQAFPGYASSPDQYMTKPQAAGVKAVIWAWEDMTPAAASGQQIAFFWPYQNISSAYVDPAEGSFLKQAAKNNESATYTLEGQLIPNYPTRTVYVVFKGCERPEESVLITTHTDGINTVEEDGHVALLLYARYLAKHPPKRTTVIIFVSGHFRILDVAKGPGATSRWLADHPNLWNASSPSVNGTKSLQAVAASGVEHMGAVVYNQNLQTGYYGPVKAPNGKNYQQSEYVWACNEQMANFTFAHWQPSKLDMVPLHRARAINSGQTSQPGEGTPFLVVGIPGVSLATGPNYLLEDVNAIVADQSTLVDSSELQRQYNNLKTLWGLYDTLPKAAFGIVPQSAIPQPPPGAGPSGGNSSSTSG